MAAVRTNDAEVYAVCGWIDDTVAVMQCANAISMNKNRRADTVEHVLLDVSFQRHKASFKHH